MRVLAIGAHPDDLEIFMYGILMILKNRGDHIHLGIATDGSAGGKLIENLSKVRKKEAILGLEKLAVPTFLNIADGFLGSEPNHFIKIKNFIEKVNPQLIITHSKNDYHSDHRNLSKIVNNIASHYIPILYCDTLFGVNFMPNYYIDITEYFFQKKEAIIKHISQKPNRFSDMIELTNSFRAAQCNLPKGSFAEAYKFKKSFPFHDIRRLLPLSPSINLFNIDDHKGFL